MDMTLVAGASGFDVIVGLVLRSYVFVGIVGAIERGTIPATIAKLTVRSRHRLWQAFCMVYISREKSGRDRIVAGSRCDWRVTVSAGRQIAPGRQVGTSRLGAKLGGSRFRCIELILCELS